MSQTSKIMPVKANALLADVFKYLNKIALFTSDPNEGIFTEPSAASYSRYSIGYEDFESTEDNEIHTARHLLYGLATEVWATSENPIKAFGVYDGSTLVYWGMLTTPVPVPIDTVPVFKIYNEEKGEGIKVTLDVATAAGVSS